VEPPHDFEHPTIRFWRGELLLEQKEYKSQAKSKPTAACRSHITTTRTFSRTLRSAIPAKPIAKSLAESYALLLPTHFPEQAASEERPSALSALFDGLLVSAGVHFEKDRQKYRQVICYKRFKLAQRLSYYLSISISYAVSLPDLTMHLATVAVFISG
jgi:hypothetical protein